MKYKNKITEVDGIKFHSKKEADRYIELKLLQKAKKIKFLELQPVIPLIVNKKKLETILVILNILILKNLNIF